MESDVSHFDSNQLTTRNSPFHARTRFQSSEPPRLAVWELTLKCNLGCKHCGSRAGTSRDYELTTAEALDLVDQLAEVGFREVILIGGEAYLREDWDVIARHIANSGMTCSIVTGGRDLNEQRIARAVLAGVSQIGISLDGLEKTHDALRGVSGSWENAIGAAQRVVESGLSLSINSQINRLSLPELPAIAETLVNLEVVGWQVMLTVPMGRAADRPLLLLQPYHLLSLIPLLLEIRDNIFNKKGIALVSGNNIGYESLSNKLILDGASAGTSYSGCQAGIAGIGIEANGRIKGCPSLPTIPYAGKSIRDESLSTILQTSQPITHISKRNIKSLWGFCRTCEFADTCKAGCTWTAHTLLGRPGNNPYCYYRAESFDKAGQRERVRLKASAPGQPFDHGTYEIVIEEKDLPEDFPLIDPIPLLRVIQAFGLNKDCKSAWTDEQMKFILSNKKLVK